MAIGVKRRDKEALVTMQCQRCLKRLGPVNNTFAKARSRAPNSRYRFLYSKEVKSE